MMHRNGDVGRFCAKFPQDRCHWVSKVPHHRDAHGNVAHLSSARPNCAVPSELEVVQHTFDVGQQLFASRRHLDAARRAFNQLGPETLFQLMHLSSKCGLRNMNLLCCQRDALALSYRNEVPELPEIHVIPIQHCGDTKTVFYGMTTSFLSCARLHLNGRLVLVEADGEMDQKRTSNPRANRMATQEKVVMPRWKQLTAAIVGNALEWYDFGVFASLAVIISKVFFPTESQYTGLLLTMATIGVGFVTRPIGGVLIGMYADRKGRRAALQLVLSLMTLSLIMIVLTPSYATIGIGAPVIIVMARLIQGFATGGEFASATAYLVEAAPPGRKGLFGSWQMFGQNLATLLGALTGLLMTSLFTTEQLVSGAWRIPFVIGLVIAPVGIWIRRHLEEPEEAQEGRRAAEEQSLRALFSGYRRPIVATLMLTTALTSSVYAFVMYLPTYASREFGFALHDAYMAQATGLVLMTVSIPVFGHLSDRFGRRAVMLFGLLPYVLLLYPMFHWVEVDRSFSSLLVTYAGLSFFFAGLLGPFSTTVGEQFPSKVRSTGLALCYNVAVMVFGGFAQMIVTWMIHATGLILAPVLYAVGGGIVGLAGLFLLSDSVRPRATSAPKTDRVDVVEPRMQ